MLFRIFFRLVASFSKYFESIEFKNSLVSFKKSANDIFIAYLEQTLEIFRNRSLLVNPRTILFFGKKFLEIFYIIQKNFKHKYVLSNEPVIKIKKGGIEAWELYLKEFKYLDSCFNSLTLCFKSSQVGLLGIRKSSNCT